MAWNVGLKWIGLPSCRGSLRYSNKLSFISVLRLCYHYQLPSFDIRRQAFRGKRRQRRPYYPKSSKTVRLAFPRSFVELREKSLPSAILQRALEMQGNRSKEPLPHWQRRAMGWLPRW